MNRSSPLLSVLTGATQPGAPAPGPGGPGAANGGILTGLPEPDLDREGFDPEGEAPWDEEEVDLDEEETWDEEEVEPAPRCDLWKIYQLGPRGPSWIHTEREVAVTEEVLLSMFGPGTYRVIGHHKGREVYSTLVRIGTPTPAAAPAAAPILSPSPADGGQLGQLAATLQILDRLRPPAPAPVDPVVLAERIARLLRMGQQQAPTPPMLPGGDEPSSPRALDWPEAVLYLADLVAEKFPTVTGSRLEPPQVIAFLREPGVLEEVLGAAVQDPDISARILEYFRQTQAEVPPM